MWQENRSVKINFGMGRHSFHEEKRCKNVDDKNNSKINGVDSSIHTTSPRKVLSDLKSKKYKGHLTSSRHQHFSFPEFIDEDGAALRRNVI